MFDKSSRSRDGTAPRARLARLTGQARAGPADLPSEPGPPTDDRIAASRVEQWLPAGGKHRAGRPRDVMRAVAAGSPRRQLAIVAVLAAVVAAAAAAVLLGTGSQAQQAPLPAAMGSVGSVDGRGSAVPAAPEDGRPPVVVSVVGKVRKPGLVEVRAGARVGDVLKAAGGAKRGADLTSVNLARKVVDGEQIHVGVPAAAGGTAGAGGPGAPAGKINLNSATVEQLEELPGVGEVTAQHIIDWRDRNGGFTAVEQLREVDGIGERRLATLRDRVAV